MGNLRGPHSHKHNDRGSSTEIPHSSTSPSFSNFALPLQLKSTPKDSEIPPKSSFKKYHPENLYSSTSFLLPSFSGPQKRQLRSSGNRSLHPKQVPDHSHFQDGNNRDNFPLHLSSHVGLHPGPPGRILPCPSQLVLPDFSSFHGRPSNLRLSVPPLWSLSSPLDLFKDNKTYQGSYSSSHNKIPHLSRRLPDLVSDSKEPSGPSLLHHIFSRDTWLPNQQT